MNDKQLRTKLIRLAHQNPAVRKDVLPLLTKQASNTFVSIPTDGNLYVYQIAAREQYFYQCCFELEKRLSSDKEISGPFKTSFRGRKYTCEGTFLGMMWEITLILKPSSDTLVIDASFDTAKGVGSFGPLSWSAKPSLEGPIAAIKFLGVLKKLAGK